jgi:hypothetical protein
MLPISPAVFRTFTSINQCSSCLTRLYICIHFSMLSPHPLNVCGRIVDKRCCSNFYIDLSMQLVWLSEPPCPGMQARIHRIPPPNSPSSPCASRITHPHSFIRRLVPPRPIPNLRRHAAPAQEKLFDVTRLRQHDHRPELLTRA